MGDWSSSRSAAAAVDWTIVDPPTPYEEDACLDVEAMIYTDDDADRLGYCFR